MNLLPPLPFGRRPVKAVRCTCPDCGFEETYHVGNFHTVRAHNEPPQPGDDGKAPTLCPKCGAKLKSKRVPCFLCW